MRTLIDEAVASRPDGLVVSLPSPELADAVGAARAAGIPVVSINSGSDISRRLGLLAHVGQPEKRAGYEAGRRLAAAGVRRALCINQEVGNAALDLRCRAFERALRQSGGASRVVAVDFQDTPATQRKLASAISSREIDGVLTLNTSGAEAVIDAVRAAGRAGDVPIGTFDLSPKVLEGVRRGRVRFAIDQQPYLQGMLPVIMLAQLARNGVFPAPGELIATGPQFVTRDTAAQVIRLSLQGIR
jgi:simple sugar transport system substrate-binding protein